MPKKKTEIHPINYLRDWRKHRRMSQEQLAEEAGLTHGFISQVENRKVGISQGSLSAFAVALGCQPADILLGPPSEKEKRELADQIDAGLQMLPRLSQERRDRILGAIEDAARAEGLLISVPAQRSKGG